MKQMVQVLLGVVAIAAIVALLHLQVGQDAAIDLIATSDCKQSGLARHPNGTRGERTGDCPISFSSGDFIALDLPHSQVGATFFVPRFTALGAAALAAGCANNPCFVTYDRWPGANRTMTDYVTIHFTNANGDGQYLTVKREGGNGTITFNP